MFVINRTAMFLTVDLCSGPFATSGPHEVDDRYYLIGIVWVHLISKLFHSFHRVGPIELVLWG